MFLVRPSHGSKVSSEFVIDVGRPSVSDRKGLFTATGPSTFPTDYAVGKGYQARASMHRFWLINSDLLTESFTDRLNRRNRRVPLAAFEAGQGFHADSRLGSNFGLLESRF